jgi:hypothetical protein
VRPRTWPRNCKPLTERILAHLHGPRVLWIVVWALVPWANAGTNLLLESEDRSAVWEQSDAFVLLSYGALSFAIVITLWGAERIAERLETLRATTSGEVGAGELFRETSSVVGPLVAAAVTAVAFALSTLIGDGWRTR